MKHAKTVFAALYMCVHAALLLFAAAYVFLAITARGGRIEGVVMVLVALLGLYAGNSIRKGRYEVKNIVSIAVSASLTLGLLLIITLVPMAVHKAKAAAHAQLSAQNQDVILAARQGDLTKVQDFLRQGISANTADEEGYSLLFIALMNGHSDIAWLLVKNGADINAKTPRGETVLHHVRDPDLARFFIEKGVGVNTPENENRMTPIFLQSAEIVKLLIENGAEVNVTAAKGMTPLMWHVYSGHLEGIRLLIANGADVNAANEEGSTALDIALRFGMTDIADMLRSAGTRK